MKKKTVSLFLVLSLALTALTGCGQKKEDQPQTVPATVPATQAQGETEAAGGESQPGRKAERSQRSGGPAPGGYGGL